MTGKLIFLNGVTSCGKTTVAECVKQMCALPVYVFSNDIFHNMVSQKPYQTYDRAYWHFVADTITAQYYAARGCVDAGFTVLIDGMLLDLPEYTARFGKRNIDLVRDIFAGCDFTLVDLTCPPDELRRRNIARGDRGVNQSDEQLSFMTKDYRADLTIDVMTTMPDESAEKILRLCDLPFADPASYAEYNANLRRRFLNDLLHPHDLRVALPEPDSAEPTYIFLTADNAATLLSRGYERLSDTRFVRRRPDGTVSEIVRVNENITEPIDYLGRNVLVIVDRPKGSAHPKHPDMVYEIPYGYVENGLVMPDGEPVDVYILAEDAPADEYTGRVAAVIHRRNDDEDKLVVTPEDVRPTWDEIREKTHFCERYFDSVVYKLL